MKKFVVFLLIFANLIVSSALTACQYSWECQGGYYCNNGVCVSPEATL